MGGRHAPRLDRSNHDRSPGGCPWASPTVACRLANPLPRTRRCGTGPWHTRRHCDSRTATRSQRWHRTNHPRLATGPPPGAAWPDSHDRSRLERRSCCRRSARCSPSSAARRGWQPAHDRSSSRRSAAGDTGQDRRHRLRGCQRSPPSRRRSPLSGRSAHPAQAWRGGCRTSATTVGGSSEHGHRCPGDEAGVPLAARRYRGRRGSPPHTICWSRF